MSQCEGCLGGVQLTNEYTKYDPVRKQWLCGGCRSDKEVPRAEPPTLRDLPERPGLPGAGVPQPYDEPIPGL